MIENLSFLYFSTIHFTPSVSLIGESEKQLSPENSSSQLFIVMLYSHLEQKDRLNVNGVATIPSYAS